MNRSEINYQSAVEPLKRGETVVLPTDTIYGLVCSAMQPAAVEQMYKIRQRPMNKISIILIADLTDLKIFNVALSTAQMQFLESSWPDPLSVILPCPDARWQYLHPGKTERSFRLPKPEALRSLIRQTGPLLAPSANLEGKPPARNIEDAKAYFGNQVTTYIDAGPLDSPPSRIIMLDKSGTQKQIRS